MFDRIDKNGISESELFRIEIYPDEGPIFLPDDGIGFGLVFNGRRVSEFWHTHNAWSLSWVPCYIADTAMDILNGDSTMFVGGCQVDGPFLRFESSQSAGAGPRTVFIELVEQRSEKTVVIDGLWIERESVVLQFVQCYFEYLDFLSSANRSIDRLHGYAEHPVLKDPRIMEICSAAGFDASEYIIVEDGFRKSLLALSDHIQSSAVLITKGDSGGLNDTGFEAFVQTLEPHGKRTLSIVAGAIVELYGEYHSEMEAMIAVLRGEVDIQGQVDEIVTHILTEE